MICGACVPRVWRKIVVMITIIKLTQSDRSNCNIQNYIIHPNSLTILIKILNLHLLIDDSSDETNQSFLKNYNSASLKIHLQLRLKLQGESKNKTKQNKKTNNNNNNNNNN